MTNKIHFSEVYPLVTFELIFRSTFVRYWSLILIGETHWLTIPKLLRHFFFQGPMCDINFINSINHMNTG